MNCRLLIGFCLPIVFWSCRSEKSIEQFDLDQPVVRLECGAPSGSSQGDVYAIIDDYKVKITSIKTCQSIDRSQFSKTEIPDSAIIAVGNGQNLQVFAVQTGPNYEFIRSRKRRMTPGWTYETIVAFEDGRFRFMLPVNPVDLNGIYYQSDEKDQVTRVIFLGFQDQELEAQYFELEGQMPEPSKILRELALYPAIPITRFEPDIENLEFDSDLGRGQILLNQGSLRLVFLDKTNTEGKRLVFNKL